MCQVFLMEISLKWFCSRGTVLRFLTSYFICMHFLCLVVTGMLNLSAVIGLVIVKWKNLLSQLFRGRDESIHQRGGKAGGKDESTSVQAARVYSALLCLGVRGTSQCQSVATQLKTSILHCMLHSLTCLGNICSFKGGEEKKGLFPVVCDTVS